MPEPEVIVGLPVVALKVTIPKPLLYVEEADQAILILERKEGDCLDEAFQRCKSKKEKMCHLEQIVDVTAVLAVARTRKGSDLVDVRDQSHAIEFSDGEVIEVGFYTKRFFDKFIGQFRKYHGVEKSGDSGAEISEEDQKKLLRLHAPINNILLSAPEFLYLFYTDCNFKNFAITGYPEMPGETELERFMESRDPAVRKKRIRLAKRARFDIESGDKRLSILDILTAAEHELNNCGTNPDSQYLTRRFILNLILLETEDEGERASIGSVLAGGTRKQVHRSFQAHFPEYIASKGIDLDAEQLETLTAYASIQRHLTVIGDKERDLYAAREKVIGFESQFPDIITAYRGATKHIKKGDTAVIRREVLQVAYTDRQDLSERDRLLRLYIERMIDYDNIVSYRASHISRLKSRLKKAEHHEFLEQLQKLYHI